MKSLVSLWWGLLFWSYIVTKVWGTSFVLWSWWWLLMPLIPWLWLTIRHFGL